MTQENARSQKLTFSRRRFWGLAGLALVRSSAPQQFVKIPPHLPAPQFAIGDKVADFWTDEFEETQREIGTVTGICWHPRKCQWQYPIDWTEGAGPEWMYPCFDQQLIESTPGAELRLLEAA